jgi:hypothetical protein
LSIDPENNKAKRKLAMVLDQAKSSALPEWPKAIIIIKE